MSSAYGNARAIASEISKKSNRKRVVQGRSSNKANSFVELAAQSKKEDSLLWLWKCRDSGAEELG